MLISALIVGRKQEPDEPIFFLAEYPLVTVTAFGYRIPISF
jgi:hypothetical protein